MNSRTQIRMLPDGRRLHLQDGPIDVILEAFGDPTEIQRAYQAATERFVEILDELCAELELLRQPAGAQEISPSGVIARRMLTAVAPYASRTFITPMAAVAGAVAEEVLAAMVTRAELLRAYVNDGGDIALHLTPGQHFVIGMADLPDQPAQAASRKAQAHPTLFATAEIDFSQSIRGIATSGWRGRSFSLGIADSVTVLADSAPTADAAATVVANAVDLPGHPGIRRVPAIELDPNSDLGTRLVTQGVGDLTHDEIRSALAAGSCVAESLRASGLIRAAALTLQQQVSVIGVECSSRFVDVPSTDRRLICA